MKTKIVYSLTSSDKDIYLEQMWVSVTSLRLYNSDINVSLLVDSSTKESMFGNRSKVLDLIDEVIVVPTPEGYSQKEMSRHIKTSVRRWIHGEFLFLDTDTIVTGDLSEIDYIKGDILMCPEFHDTFYNFPMRPALIDRIKRVFDTDISDAPYYYNSGIILCRDTKLAHDFYEKWNENWTFAAKYKSDNFDQPALIKSDHDLGYVIKELDGRFHCQLFLSIKYLHEAKIIHFFNMKWFKDDPISPFFATDIYWDIKKKGEIDQQTLLMIKNVKSHFSPVSVPVGRKEFELLVDYGQSLMKIIVNPSTKVQHLCKWLIKKVIFLYWILNKLNKTQK